MVSLLAVHAIAKKLWPERVDARFVALAILALSPQLLITAMTPYAMTAHFAFNCIWLWLFLRDDWRGHAGAVCVGFVATGLHQILFHPLFVAPFVIQLWLQKRRRTVIFYVFAYCAIGLFWAQWFGFAMRLHGFEAAAAKGNGFEYIIARATQLLADFDLRGIHAMVKNILRFISWQHLLLIPLAVIGCFGLRRADPVLRSLAAGLALALIAMFVLLPGQGHGWGYRYLHGVMVNVALLAAWGWIRLCESLGVEEQGRIRTSFFAASAVMLFALLPLRMWQARQTVQPFFNASLAIQMSNADIVLVDNSDHRFAVDLVRNDPFLRNKPITMEISRLEPAQVRDLCSRLRIAIFESAHARAFGIEEEQVGPEYKILVEGVRAEFRKNACGEPLKIEHGQ